MNAQVPHSVQERNRLHQVRDGVWMWSVFSDEKGLYFNGYVVRTIQGLVIVDPPLASQEVFAMISSLGAPKLIIVSNRDHERESAAFCQHFRIPIAAHEADAALLEREPEFTFQDGETLCGDVDVIHLADQKSPGESALYFELQKSLYLGDALIGKPQGELNMLPDDKYADKQKARLGLEKLRQIDKDIQALLLGDGEPILQDGKGALDRFFG